MLTNIINKTKISLGLIKSNDLTIIKLIERKGMSIKHVLISPGTPNNTYKIQYGSVIELHIRLELHLDETILLLISSLINLRVLSLSSLKINYLPHSFSNLTRLKELHLIHNRFENIPSAVFELKNLEFLNMYNNSLVKVSNNISKLKNLSVLELSNNNLTDIPVSISKLKRLKSLMCGVNKLKFIPSGILQLYSLELLDLHNNRIDEIPYNINNLLNLRDLSFNNISAYEDTNEHMFPMHVEINNIKSIPTSMKKMINLKNIGLDNNPITKNIVNKNTTDAKLIINELLEYQNNFHNENKTYKSITQSGISNDFADINNIFISYRRKDSTNITGRIYDRLTIEYGREKIFKDVDSIPLGADFKTFIDKIISQSNVLLIIIGPDWVGETDTFRRIDDPNDFVRVEVKSALSQKIPIIPIFVKNVKMPDENILPSDIKELVFKNGICVRNDPDFNNDMLKLIHGINASLTSTTANKTFEGTN